MTQPRDTTLALLRALARGGTMAELVEMVGLSERSIRRHLSRLEAEGIEIIRPEGVGAREPGQYRLGNRKLAEALAMEDDR